MSTYPDLDAAIYAKLAGDAGVTGIVSTRIYSGQAPGGASVPYVIFVGASEIISNLQKRDDINAVFRVDGWHTTRAGAEQIAAAVYGALHQQEVSITGWSNFWLACERKQNFVANLTDGTQFYRRIWDVRLRASRD